MASSSPLTSKFGFHARSVSLPAQIPHPLTPQFDEHLGRLRALEATSSSLSSISERLSVLEDMHDCFDDLLLLPNTQQAFSQKQNEKRVVEEALDGHLRLLDVCATAKDVSSQTKQDVQNLLSMLRRRKDANELGEYLTSRKKAKKAIQKSLKNLKSIKSKHKDHEIQAIFTLLKEVEAATIAVLESLLSYIAVTKEQSRLSGFSLVSKIMNGKIVDPQDEETDTNEFEKFDAALNSLICHKISTSHKLQNQLQKMELGIQDVEVGLEGLFRRLIKTRVSLLNILNH